MYKKRQSNDDFNNKDELISLDKCIFKDEEEYNMVTEELDVYYQELKEKAKLKQLSRNK